MKFIKKHLKLIVFIVVCLSIYLIYQNNNKNISYTSLGDGLSLGEDSYGQINYGYSDYLKDFYIKKNKLSYFTKSFSSKEESISSLYEKLITNKEILENGKRVNLKQTLRESTIVTLSIGLNDLKYKLNIMSNISKYKINKVVEETTSSFDKLIKEIRKYYPYKIYVIGYYGDQNNLYLTNALKQLNDYYSTKPEIIYIETASIFTNNNQFLSNPSSYYPNNAGYKAIFRQIKQKLPKKD